MLIATTPFGIPKDLKCVTVYPTPVRPLENISLAVGLPVMRVKSIDAPLLSPPCSKNLILSIY